MKIDINIEDYLDKDEIKEECKYAIGNSVHEMFCRKESDIDRLITNLGYEFIFDAVSKAIGKDAEKVIAEKVTELVQNESSIRYELWRRKDTWDRTNSPAIEILYKAIDDNEQLMRDCIEKAIKEYKFPDVREAMYDIACDIIRDKLFSEDN